MRIGLCHENVLPARGGAEMYVGDLARRFATEGHDVHLFACRWDAAALPASVVIHPVDAPKGPRFLRPWRFNAAVRRALDGANVDVTVGFDKTFVTDIYYPLGGLQPASAASNLSKHRGGFARFVAGVSKSVDLAHRSFAKLERESLLGPNPPRLVVNSAMVRDHARDYYGIDPETVGVIHNAIDPMRFVESDRPRVRSDFRRHWGIGPNEVVAAFVAMNYHLKGLESLLHSLTLIPESAPLRLLVVGSERVGRWQAYAKQLGVHRRVTFAGHSGDVRRVYFASDLHVHPTHYDPCSGVVLEALACGLPVVTTRQNGAAELMTADEGFVLDDAHDDRGLADALTQLLNPVTRDAMGRSARRAAAVWTLDDHCRRWLDLFGDVAARRVA